MSGVQTLTKKKNLLLQSRSLLQHVYQNSTTMTNREFLHQIHALTRELVHSAPSRALRPQPHSRLGGAFASRSLQTELYKVSLPSLVLPTSSVISTTKNKKKILSFKPFIKYLEHNQQR